MPCWFTSTWDPDKSRRREKLYKELIQEFIAKGKSLRNAETCAWAKARNKVGY